jgi:phosphonate transport system substrate-binding protein
MTIRPVFALIALIGVFLNYGCQEQSIKVSATSQASGVIVLGDIAIEPEYAQKKIQPIADYLAHHLETIGIGKGQVKVAPDKETMVRWIKSGEVDIYMDSPYPAMFAIDRAGGQAILRRWKDGVAEYDSVFFVRKDSNIDSLTDIKGKMLALEIAFSSSGYMFPLSYLKQNGFKAVPKAEANHQVGKDEVGFVFAGEEFNIVRWVLAKKVQVGATNEEILNQLSESQRSQLKIIAKTEKFPRHIVVGAPDLSPKEITAIKKVLKNMHQEEEGIKILQEFKKTAKFDEFPQGTAASFDKLREAYKAVK